MSGLKRMSNSVSDKEQTDAAACLIAFTVVDSEKHS